MAPAGSKILGGDILVLLIARRWWIAGTRLARSGGHGSDAGAGRSGCKVNSGSEVCLTLSNCLLAVSDDDVFKAF